MSSPFRLNHVAIPAPDMEASAAFYAALGYSRGFAREEDGRITLLQLHQGDAFVELIADAGTPGGHLGLRTDDMQKALAHLASHGIHPEGPPRRGQTGILFAFFRDPAGNSVEVTAP